MAILSGFKRQLGGCALCKLHFTIYRMFRLWLGYVMSRDEEWLQGENILHRLNEINSHSYERGQTEETCLYDIMGDLP